VHMATPFRCLPPRANRIRSAGGTSDLEA
jgi:hypothetical protein